jgi:hypothetical protein
MIYFIEKVVFKNYSNTDETFPKHKIVEHAYSLEEAIESVKQCAFDYVVKKNRKLFDKTKDSKRTENEDITYTMKCHPMNEHMIEIFKTKHVQSSRGWFSSSDIRSIEEKVSYFCYIPYEKNLQESAVPPPPPIRMVSPSIVQKKQDHAKLLNELIQDKRFKNKKTTLEAAHDFEEINTFINGLILN